MVSHARILGGLDKCCKSNYSFEGFGGGGVKFGKYISICGCVKETDLVEREDTIIVCVPAVARMTLLSR